MQARCRSQDKKVTCFWFRTPLQTQECSGWGQYLPPGKYSHTSSRCFELSSVPNSRTWKFWASLFKVIIFMETSLAGNITESFKSLNLDFCKIFLSSTPCIRLPVLKLKYGSVIHCFHFMFNRWKFWGNFTSPLIYCVRAEYHSFVLDISEPLVLVADPKTR